MLWILIALLTLCGILFIILLSKSKKAKKQYKKIEELEERLIAHENGKKPKDSNQWKPPKTVKVFASWVIASFTGFLFFLLGTSIFLGGTLLCGVLGYMLGRLFGVGWGGFVSSAVVWIALYVAWGFRSLGFREFEVVERFGTFYRIMLGGWHVLCFPGIIDRIVTWPAEENNFEIKDLRLYEGEMIDLKDSSVSVVGHAYYQIRQTPEGVLRWQYLISDVRIKIKDLFENFTRGVLQGWTVDQASEERSRLWRVVQAQHEKEGTEELLKESLRGLNDLGVDIDDDNPIIISDISLSKEVQDLRIKTLQGEKEAELRRLTGRGFAEQLTAFKRQALGLSAKEADPKIQISDEELAKFILDQAALQTLQQTGANVTLIAPTMGQVGTMVRTGGENG